MGVVQKFELFLYGIQVLPVVAGVYPPLVGDRIDNPLPIPQDAYVEGQAAINFFLRRAFQFFPYHTVDRAGAVGTVVRAASSHTFLGRVPAFRSMGYTESPEQGMHARDADVSVFREVLDKFDRLMETLAPGGPEDRTTGRLDLNLSRLGRPHTHPQYVIGDWRGGARVTVGGLSLAFQLDGAVSDRRMIIHDENDGTNYVFRPAVSPAPARP